MDIDSITMGTTLDPTTTIFNTWRGDFLNYIDISYQGDAIGTITNLAGNAHLANIYLRSYRDWQFDTATAVITSNLIVLNDILGNALVLEQFYTDDAVIELTAPPIVPGK